MLVDKVKHILVPKSFLSQTINSEEIVKYIDYILYDLRIQSTSFEETDCIDFINLSIDNYNSPHQRCVLHNTKRFVLYIGNQIQKIKNKNEKDKLWDKLISVLISEKSKEIYTSLLVKIYTDKISGISKEKLFNYLTIDLFDKLGNKDCNKLIKRSNDAEINERLWNKIINNNPTWGDLNHLYLFTNTHKEKAGELLQKLFPERFIKEYNPKQYIDIQVKKKIGEEAFKEFSELRVINKKEFFEIKNNYDHLSYQTNIHPRYVVIKFSNNEECEMVNLKDFHLFGCKYKLTLKLIVKMLIEEFY